MLPRPFQSTYLSKFLCETPAVSIIFSPLIFYIAFSLIMLGNTMGGFIPMMVITNNWFTRYRSLAMAVVTLGFSLGTFIIVPIMALLISPNVLGWRNASLLVAFIAIIFKYSSLSALSASLIALNVLIFTNDPQLKIFILITILIFLKHINNIRRLILGNETKLNFKNKI